jgi:hypothetical protein
MPIPREQTMNTIMPQSALVKKAAVFVSETKAEQPEKNLSAIIDEAAMRFNLSPLDSEALLRLFSDSDDESE